MIPVTSFSAIVQLFQANNNSTLIPYILTPNNRLVPLNPDLSQSDNSEKKDK